jgi:hypothetical protein
VVGCEAPAQGGGKGTGDHRGEGDLARTPCRRARRRVCVFRLPDLKPGRIAPSVEFMWLGSSKHTGGSVLGLNWCPDRIPVEQTRRRADGPCGVCLPLGPSATGAPSLRPRACLILLRSCDVRVAPAQVVLLSVFFFSVFLFSFLKFEQL